MRRSLPRVTLTFSLLASLASALGCLRLGGSSIGTSFSSAPPASQPNPPAALARAAGVNLLTTCASWPSHWGYPAEITNVAWDLDYYKSKGLTTHRLIISWESIQPNLYGPLTSWQVSCLHDVLNLARQKNVRLIFDIHNYARYYVNNQGGTVGAPTDADNALLGSPQLPITALADLWGRIATEFSADAGLFAYDLMNEPHDMLDPTVWPAAVQASVNAIRLHDQTTSVMVEGDGWASAVDWVANNPNLAPVDPANNLIFEAHQYFDAYGAGQYTSTYDQYAAYPELGVDRATPFVNWLKSNGHRGFVGEYGVPGDDPRWAVVLDNFLAYLSANGVGGTAWAGGYLWPAWGQETVWYNLEPQAGNTMPANPIDKPLMSVLSKYPAR